MRRNIFWPSSAIIIGLLAATLASAHDASLHKGKPTTGEIVSITGEKMQLQAQSGPVTVVLNNKTKYEHGNQTVTKSHLKAGEKVSVFGTKLATGELVAKEVLIGAPAAATNHDAHHSDHDAHHK